MLKILNFELLMLFICDIILCLGTEKNPGFIYKLQSYWFFFLSKNESSDSYEKLFFNDTGIAKFYFLCE